MTAQDPVEPVAPARVAVAAVLSKTTLGVGAATLGGVLLAIEMVTTSWLIPEVLDKVDVRMQQVVPGMLDQAVARATDARAGVVELQLEKFEMQLEHLAQTHDTDAIQAQLVVLVELLRGIGDQLKKR